MTKQTEAQRWAGILEHQARYDGPTDYKHKAAAELRRLEQSEREGWRYADELEQERKRLSNLNAELVEALSKAADQLTVAAIVLKSNGGSATRQIEAAHMCLEASAKAKEQS